MNKLTSTHFISSSQLLSLSLQTSIEWVKKITLSIHVLSSTKRKKEKLQKRKKQWCYKRNLESAVRNFYLKFIVLELLLT